MSAHDAFTVLPFCDQHHPSKVFAKMHLKIRQWQQDNAQNSFADIYSSQADLSDIHSRYIEPGGQFLVALSAAGDPLGFIGLAPTLPALGELRRFAVLPEYQGNGIGHRLCAEIIRWADDNGFVQIDLKTGPKEHAVGIYEKHGFETMETDPSDGGLIMTRFPRASDRR